ncbi:pancreatic progenitor cell differentiation and proliferation factor-like [Choloepus didactylus]|uniref:pancreatic progenitor cell differentiation and proliferation factor-like n=1 Tax=Choloepus didactylus TaxID=27675 RepID=UPI0018A04881|nr:pancreatic progenitor cell differentiation and proliferation factor-like [Choloepus didactylus]
MAAVLSSGSLVATHNYYRCCLGPASSNSSCGGARYTLEKPSPQPWGQAPSSGSPPSYPWPLCWRPQSPRSLPGLQRHDHRCDLLRKQPGGQPGRGSTGSPS